MLTYRLHYAPDNASLIIRLTLEEMGVPFETVLVDRRAKAHKSSAYLAMNPNGLIPVLETPDGPIFETAAILLWLADRHGALAPSVDSQQRAAFLKWLFFVSNTLHPAMRMLFYPHCYVGRDGSAQGMLRTHMYGEAAGHFAKLDRLAAEQPGWFAGETSSVLDFYVACILRWAALYPDKGRPELALSNWPNLMAMCARLETCEAVRAAIDAEGMGPHPFTNPDYATPPEGSAT
jgi:glutathione S-transferase